MSRHDKTIDWDKARKELDFVIIRSSVGLKTDPQFVRNALLCGIPFGVYHYVEAGTAEAAEKEAEYFYHAARGFSDEKTVYAKNKKPAMVAKEGDISPLFWAVDIEADAQTRETTETVTRAFLEKLRSFGVRKIGLYANTRRKYMSDELVASFDWTWVPRYGPDDGEAHPDEFPPKYPCDIWQYTTVGAIDGIDHDVDLNMLYGEKPLEYFTMRSAVKITGGSVNVREFAGTSSKIVGVAHAGDILERVGLDGWVPVVWNGRMCWVSWKHAESVD